MAQNGGMNSRLQMRQCQTLGLNQQQQQSLRFLQMSGPDLEKAVAEEVDRNPFLTVESRASDARRAENIVREGRAATRGLRERTSVGSSASNWLDAVPEAAPSLAMHLTRQAELGLCAADLLVAQTIIAAIEDTGYLGEPVGQLADRLGIGANHVARVLSLVQSFEPAGIAARSLAECLLLQAIDADEADEAMQALLDHLPLLAEGRLAKLERLCGVDGEGLGRLISRLRRYDPKPGLQFAPPENGWLNPDIMVRADADGWRVDLAFGALPSVAIAKDARATTARCRDTDAKNWLNECANDARSLVNAISHRQRTLLAVTTKILEHQTAFLNEGVAGLRPLTMREIADELGMHESTVSRAVANKSLNCPRGTFELRFFFPSGIAQQVGEAASAETIKATIKSLIAGESAANVLSDDALVIRLQALGYDVARRTVAKYRDALGLGNSSERRRRLVLQAASGSARRAA